MRKISISDTFHSPAVFGCFHFGPLIFDLSLILKAWFETVFYNFLQFLTALHGLGLLKSISTLTWSKRLASSMIVRPGPHPASRAFPILTPYFSHISKQTYKIKNDTDCGEIMFYIRNWNLCPFNIFVWLPGNQLLFEIGVEGKTRGRIPQGWFEYLKIKKFIGLSLHTDVEI